MRCAVEAPCGYSPERLYIASVMLSEFLGFDVTFTQSGRKDTAISLDDRKFLTVEDGLFAVPAEEWLQPGSLPGRPLKFWHAGELFPGTTLAFPAVPAVYGAGAPTAPSRGGASLHLPIDIFGSCFFMLARYEEAVIRDRDGHGRFPASGAVALQEGFFERPVVNEYLNILWVALKRLWPGIVRKKREYRLLLTHDVDHLFHVAGYPLKAAIRRIGGDVIVRRDPVLAMRSARAVLQSRRGVMTKDPCNTFDFIMDTGEKYGLRSTFNFFPCMGETEYDRRYDIAQPFVRPFLRLVARRGHLLGFHPTYHTHLAPPRTAMEFNRLVHIAGQEGIEQAEWGGRQHYLRWENPTTWQNWEDAGLNYDSSLGFKETIGFRSGCCYEYPVYNVETRRQLALRERPLVVMEEGAAEGREWMTQEGLGNIVRLSAECRKFEGDFTLLWHNSSLISRRQRAAYEAVLRACA